MLPVQLASLGAERESLAQQNTALAAALSDKLAWAAAAAEVVAGDTDLQQQQQSVSPAQLRELGALLQRLTQENAGLIKAR